MYLGSLYNRIKFSIRLKRKAIKTILSISLFIISIIIIYKFSVSAVTYTFVNTNGQYGEKYSTDGETITDGTNQIYHYPNYQLDVVLPEAIDSNRHYALFSVAIYNGGYYYRSYVLIKTSNNSHTLWYENINPFVMGDSPNRFLVMGLRSYDSTYNAQLVDIWKSIDGNNWVTVTSSSNNNNPNINTDYGRSIFYQYEDGHTSSVNYFILWSNKDIYQRYVENNCFITKNTLEFAGQPESALQYVPPTPTPTQYTSPTPVPDEFQGVPINPDGTLPNFDDVMDDAFNFPSMPLTTDIPALLQWLASCMMQIFAGLLSILNYLLARIVNVVELMGHVISKIPFIYHALMILALIFAIITRVLRGAHG